MKKTNKIRFDHLTTGSDAPLPSPPVDKLDKSGGKISICNFFFILEILSAVFITLSCSVTEENSCTTPDSYAEARVLAVIDGDTIKIEFTDIPPYGCRKKETVRLIGVNTPETTTGEFYADKAKIYTNQLWQETVYVETDPYTSLHDRYNRLLAYVYCTYEDESWNQLLIENGYGRYYDIFMFSPEKMQLFATAQLSAQTLCRGLWSFQKE